MKKFAFIFVAAIAASFAISMTSCNKGNDSTAVDTVDTVAVEEPAVVEEDTTCCDSACCDSAEVVEAPVAE